MNVFIHSDHFYSASSIAPLQVRYYSEALPTQHGYCAGVSRRSATGNCELRTCSRSLCASYGWIQTHDPPVKRLRLCECATTSHNWTYLLESFDSKFRVLFLPLS